MEMELEYIQNLRKKGYTEDFTSTPSYDILFNCEKIYKPRDLKIAAYYKYPADVNGDNYVLFAIETNDGKKGILIDNCGASIDDKVSQFIHIVNVARMRSKRFKFFEPVQNLFRLKFSSDV